MTVLMGLSSIAVEQTKATEKTMERCINLLNYLVTNQDAKVVFRASDMVMNIHSDASYLSKTNLRSRSCGHFFMGWMPKNDKRIQLNGAFYVSDVLLWHPQLKPNLAPSSTIARMELFSNKRWRTWATHNHEPPHIAIMPRRSGLPVTP